MKFAEILFLRKVGNDKETLTYQIPKELEIKEGFSVNVSLRNKETAGIVWKIHKKKPSYKTKPIINANYNSPLLDKDKLKLIKWMSDYYFCPKFQILKLFITNRVLINKPYRTKKEKKSEQKKHRISHSLNEEQELALNKIKKETSNIFLIQGVTGSGKTELYTKLTKQEIKKDNQTLILVPEISLTPQTIKYFEDRLETKAAVIHSKLKASQRFNNWIKIWKGKAKLIIGSRSALLSPFKNLGLIIIDEEHENSYKQESSPRYQVHKTIEKIQEINPKIKAVYGSATPNIESSEKLKNSTITLKKRYSKLPMPEIQIVDLREEFKKGNYSIFSEKLHKEINQALHNSEQIILFLNRRGSASTIICRDCGYTSKCPDCETNMTYHERTISSKSLICHHCGKILSPPKKCPDCKSIYIKELGIGTQKIENEVKKNFPTAKILRADKDTTGQKDSFKKIYQAFKNHKADILIGTQMIAKGLHLPKVNLVGVIISDIGLNIPDFRSTERIFQLMTQVAGRAGRSKKQGKVIIQTYNPENPVYQFVKNQDYEDFFKYERTQRKILKNPPFSQLAKILIEENSEKKAQETAKKISLKLNEIILKEGLDKEFRINLYPAYLTKLRNKYRYIVLIKSLSKKVNHLIRKLPGEYIQNSKLKIDIDPISIT